MPPWRNRNEIGPELRCKALIVWYPDEKSCLDPVTGESRLKLLVRSQPAQINTRLPVDIDENARRMDVCIHYLPRLCGLNLNAIYEIGAFTGGGRVKSANGEIFWEGADDSGT